MIVAANQQQRLGTDAWVFAAAYLALFACAHVVIRRFASSADPVLLPVVALLNGLGLVMIYRLDLGDAGLSSAGARGPSAYQQMLWTLAGVAAFCLVVVFVRDHRPLARYGYVCGAAGLILLAIPAVLPRSLSEQNGAKIWIRLPGFSIEPAEMAKILLLVFVAAVLVAKREMFTTAGTHFLGMNLPRPRDLAPLLAALAISVAVMVFETDLGAALLVFASFLAMVYVATGRLGWVGIGLLPFADPDGAGYQMVQSMFSFATGGVFGTGLGNGQPGTVPVASSDFIMAAFGEELGLVGLAALLMLYTILIMRGLRTAIVVRDSFGKLLSAGLACTLAIQVFLVVGG